jgi:hypothetical protein
MRGRRGWVRRRHEGYGGRAGREEHRAVRTGHVLRPEYSKKLTRLLTRLFR